MRYVGTNGPYAVPAQPKFGTAQTALRMDVTLTQQGGYPVRLTAPRIDGGDDARDGKRSRRG